MNENRQMYLEEYHGLSQYRAAFNYELAGKTLNLYLDDGSRRVLQFLTGELVQIWSSEEGMAIYEYECLKSRAAVYLVQITLGRNPVLQAMTLVIDLVRDLVTVQFAEQGRHADYPKLVDRKIIFGAIKQPGIPLPGERHTYTQDLVGKKIEYTYSPNFRVTHIYYSKNRCRTTAPSGEGISAPPPKMKEIFEEPAVYIKIGEELYVFSWIEKNCGNGGLGFMLMDTHRKTDVGVFFGETGNGEAGFMISAVGRYVDTPLLEESVPSPYEYDDEEGGC